MYVVDIIALLFDDRLRASSGCKLLQKAVKGHGGPGYGIEGDSDLGKWS